MKKFLIVMLCLLTLVACKKPEQETHVYKFDFIDYLDIDLIGPDGYAVLDINIADFSVKDFANESDYITIKKAMNVLYDSIIPSKTENISNGDVIQIGITNTFNVEELNGLDINLNVHEFTINSLLPAKVMELFNEENVVFYGLEDTKEVYYYFPRTSALTKEMEENIKYDISIDDEKVALNKTVLSLSVSLNEELLDSNTRYQTEQRYFLANGYITELEGEKTLKVIVKDKEMEKATGEELRMVLEEVAEKEVDKYELDQVVSFHKGEKPFEYFAVYKYTKDEKNVFIKYRLYMAYVNKEITVFSCNKEHTVDEAFATQALDNTTLLETWTNFIIEEPVEETHENVE